MFRLLTGALQKSLFKHQRNVVVASMGGVIVALLVLVVSTAVFYVLDKLWVVATNSVFGLYGFLGAVSLAGAAGQPIASGGRQGQREIPPVGGEASIFSGIP